MDLEFFKKCISQGLSKEEALEFCKAAEGSHPKKAKAKKSTVEYGAINDRLESFKARNHEFRTVELVKACEEAGSTSPTGYADMWARAQIEAGKIVRIAHGLYRTI